MISLLLAAKIIFAKAVEEGEISVERRNFQLVNSSHRRSWRSLPGFCSRTRSLSLTSDSQEYRSKHELWYRG